MAERRAIILTVVSLVVAFVAVASPEPVVAANAKAIVGQLESPRGVCAIVGDVKAGLAMKVAKASELLVYVQLSGGKETEAARRAAAAAGLLGNRVYVEQGSYDRLHLADNLADAVVVTDAARKDVDEKEVMRILRPGGKAFLGNKIVVKPFPEGIDDWSHPSHGPDNNPQSADQVARAPYLTQFLAEPYYCPIPALAVASHGRIFRAFGDRAFKRPQWPWINTLMAMNGYNGTILWKRKLNPDFMIHRNTIIATPQTLYLGDNVSCKLLDAATGELKGEIKVSENISDGPVWKWMGLEGGILYALVGENEPRGETLKGTTFRGAGWPWWGINKYQWGFGRTIIAIDPTTRKILWHHRETESLDSRGMCMKNGRIFFYSHKQFVGCLDAKTGKVLWKIDAPETLEAIGEHFGAQHFMWGFSHASYVMCNDKALYFVGVQRKRIVALAAGGGKLLWQHPFGNYQSLLRDDGLYAMGSRQPSVKFDLLTGKSLGELAKRYHCTRATGSIDRIFVRAGAGTLSWDVKSGKRLGIAPMRPGCQDGVVIASGHLYWGPWICGCPLSLVGSVTLAPAGDFDYTVKATEGERLEAAEDAAKVAPLAVAADDWPAYRRDNARGVLSKQTIASKASVLWRYKPRSRNTPAAPVTAGGLVFVAGSDGMVRALVAASGKKRWVAYTGGAVRFPPAIADGRALVGSGDGWVYAFEAVSGRLLWRFRAAPVERKISVHGALLSTWPVGSGVLAEDGTVYAAAGIANHDGTRVYALDAATGKIRWQNNTSGRTEGGQGVGVTIVGPLLFHNKTLYLPGGNTVAVASYDEKGKFRNAGSPHLGKDLFVQEDGKRVIATGLFPLYSRPEDFHYIEDAELPGPAGTLRITPASRVVNWRSEVDRPQEGEEREGNTLRMFKTGEARVKNAVPLWRSRPFGEVIGVAIAANAVVAVGTNRKFEKPDGPPVETHGIAAVNIADGSLLWSLPLPAGPVSWGVAIGHRGRIIVALQDGSVVCITTK